MSGKIKDYFTNKENYIIKKRDIYAMRILVVAAISYFGVQLIRVDRAVDEWHQSNEGINQEVIELIEGVKKDRMEMCNSIGELRKTIKDLSSELEVYSNKVRKKIEFPDWYIEEKVKERASKLDDLTRGDPEIK